MSVKCDAHGLSPVCISQKSVIDTAAVAQAPAVIVKGQAGNDGNIRLQRTSQVLLANRQRAGVFVGQRRQPVPVPLIAIPGRGRQVTAGAQGLVQEWADVGLVGQRQVGPQVQSRAQRYQLAQLPHNRAAGSRNIPVRQVCPARDLLLSEYSFSVHRHPLGPRGNDSGRSGQDRCSFLRIRFKTRERRGGRPRTGLLKWVPGFNHLKSFKRHDIRLK